MKHLALIVWITIGCPIARGADPVHFNQDIRPILSKKCIQCHGPDANKGRKGDLRLDIPDGPEGAYRILDGSQAIKPGNLEASELWKRINHSDPQEIMPPPQEKSHVTPLTSNERELLKQWILQGAEYEAFWSFVPPRDHPLPATNNSEWSSRAIDQFILARLEEKNLKPGPEAGKRALIRRATIDLTGLPPTLEEIDAFLTDSSEDAYERLVDRLLASSAYGEHMAKYWLDLVRFADTNGMHHDHYRDMTPYRDWVIRSFNDNLPYNEFTKYQIAGDLYPEPSTEQLIASGFNRLHLIIDAGTALPEESDFKNVVDRVSAVGTAFMGLTMQCAVCHDHKFDPITQKDFYQMYAFFNNFDGAPETGRRGGPDFKRGLQPPYIHLTSTEQDQELVRLNQNLASLNDELGSLKSQKAPAGQIKEKTEEIKSSQAVLDRFMETLTGAMISKERNDLKKTHIHHRGEYDKPGEEVFADTPGFLPALEKQGPKDRMDLAEWLVDPGNPLTARVAVNRFWQQFFGVGLVKTSEDFGAQGEWPSHPLLLDYLTMEFVKSGWDIKALVKSIVLTKTYQQSSTAPRESFVNDPENRWLTRGPRFRMDSEIIRDQILAVSGLLNREMYGKSVKPPQPADLWKSVTMPTSYPNAYEADKGDKIYRRSVYTFWKRGFAPPQMTIFDAPNRDSCIARRERTNTPLQALLMMNEEQYFECARKLAKNLLDSTEPGDDKRLTRAYESISSQLPAESTLEELRSGLADFRSLFSQDRESAKQVADTDENAEELASWTMMVHSLFNLDATRTRE